MPTLHRVALTAFTLLLSACVIVVPGVVSGNGDITSEARGLTGFTAVENRTSLKVRIHETQKFAVTTRIDSNLQDYLRLEVTHGLLTIDLQSASGINPTGTATVDIEVPDFYGARALGSGRMEISGVTGSRDLTLYSAGSGGLTFDGTAHDLEADCRGSGSVELTGAVAMLSAAVMGSGSIDAAELDATSADLSTDGSGSIAATLGGGWVKLRVHGSGSIDWWGNADVLLFEDFGSGRITHHYP